jgi:hypothetical protein
MENLVNFLRELFRSQSQVFTGIEINFSSLINSLFGTFNKIPSKKLTDFLYLRLVSEKKHGL